MKGWMGEEGVLNGHIDRKLIAEIKNAPKSKASY
jgi:hypothetical protein